jgi:hypothetical protein
MPRRAPAADAGLPRLLFDDTIGRRGRRVATIRIEHWHPPTKNQITKGKRRVGIRLKKSCREMMIEARRKLGLPAATRFRRIWLAIGLAPAARPCDVDAYWLSLLDGLKGAGLIVDDRPAWVVIMPVTYYRDRANWTRITLEEL